MSPTLTHLALHVRDLAACIDFYERFCGMRCIHRRPAEGDGVVAWLAEPGRENELILLLITGGPNRHTEGEDYGHLGFAVESRERVDALAKRADTEGCLVWPPREEPYPVGYYCGVKDPDGNFVEFSYGQPLGPGAEELDAERIGGDAYKR